jgi:zinc/manganese transport system substrate-binding protein
MSGKNGSRAPVLAVAVVVLLVIAVVAGYYLTRAPAPPPSSTDSGSGTVIPIVAAENFWGSLVQQLAGEHGSVTSIISDPNADPHEYQSNTAAATAVADAKLVIVNGMNYDQWAGQLINASDNPGQTVINIQRVVGITNDQLATLNPHLWYSPYYVNDSVRAFYGALVKIDPADTSYFDSNYATLNSSLYHDYMQREAQIKSQFGGTPVAATESIFIFMANATGLNIISPPGLMRAVSEGNDPSPTDIATFEQQLEGGNATVRCMVYNAQTITPLTQQLQTLATQHGIPLTSVTETVQPPDLAFQSWMQGEVAGLQNCLDHQTAG